MQFINMTPAWDWNNPTRTICIEPKFKLEWSYQRIGHHTQRLIRYGAFGE